MSRKPIKEIQCLLNLKTGQASCPVDVTVHFQSQKLVQIRLDTSPHFRLFFEGTSPDQSAIVQWFEDYLEGTHSPFPLELPIDLGTFSSRVLKALGKIPFGELRTYGKIAAELDNPKGARAVGNACNRNPFPLIIPCHRIVMSNGEMGGFAYGIGMKQALIEFERLLTIPS